MLREFTERALLCGTPCPRLAWRYCRSSVAVRSFTELELINSVSPQLSVCALCQTNYHARRAKTPACTRCASAVWRATSHQARARLLALLAKGQGINHKQNTLATRMRGCCWVYARREEGMRGCVREFRGNCVHIYTHTHKQQRMCTAPR